MEDTISPLVSVIVPTYNREKVLCDTIEYLLHQDYAYYEIIVVDQTKSHTSEVQSKIDNSVASEKRFKYKKLDQPGLPNARNEGLKMAHGSIVLFVDDDIIIESTFISSHVASFADPTVGGVAGRVIGEGIMYDDGSQTGKVLRNGTLTRNFSATRKSDVQWARGCNMSFRRDILEQIGGFDIRFNGTATFEEVDVSFRIHKLGYRLVFEPNAYIYHLAEKSGGCETRVAMQRSDYYYYRNSLLFALKNLSPLGCIRLCLERSWYGIVRSKQKKDITFVTMLVPAWLSAVRAFISAEVTPSMDRRQTIRKPLFGSRKGKSI